MHLQICQYPEATDHRIVSDIYCSRGGKWHKKISVSDSRRALNSPGRFQVVLMAAQAAPESTATTEARAAMPGTEGAAADRASLADAQSDNAQVFLCGPFFEGLSHLGRIWARNDVGIGSWHWQTLFINFYDPSSIGIRRSGSVLLDSNTPRPSARKCKRHQRQPARPPQRCNDRVRGIRL